MTPTKTDSEGVEERVEQLLRAAEEALRQLDEDADAEGDEEAGAGDGEAADGEASDVDQRRALEEFAAEVDDLVSNADTARLVSAAGVELPEDASPDSIPEAIARSDSSSLVDLRYLLLLSRLADREGEDADDVVNDLRELPRERAAEESASSEPAAEEAETDEADEADAEAAEGSETDADTADAEGAEAETDAEESETEGRFEKYESEIESRLRDSIDGFREQIEAGRSELRDQFDDESESAEAEAGGGEAAEAEAADDEAEAADGADVDEAAGETAGEESDDGLFGGFGGGETGSGRSSSGNRKQTFSTIPSTERADMKQPTRLSTLRLESKDEDEG